MEVLSPQHESRQRKLCRQWHAWHPLRMEVNSQNWDPTHAELETAEVKSNTCGCDILRYCLNSFHTGMIIRYTLQTLLYWCARRFRIGRAHAFRFQGQSNAGPCSQAAKWSTCETMWNGETVRMHQNASWRRQDMSFQKLVSLSCTRSFCWCGLRYCDFIAKPGVKCPRCLAQRCLYGLKSEVSKYWINRPTRHALIFQSNLQELTVDWKLVYLIHFTHFHLFGLKLWLIRKVTADVDRVDQCSPGMKCVFLNSLSVSSAFREWGISVHNDTRMSTIKMWRSLKTCETHLRLLFLLDVLRMLASEQTLLLCCASTSHTPATSHRAFPPWGWTTFCLIFPQFQEQKSNW